MANKGDIEVVKEIRDLYDEEATAEVHNINKRKICFSHDFINSSLQWAGVCEKDGAETFIALKNEGKKGVACNWGQGYGAIRFCRHCKHIDCIHDFTDKTYHVVQDEFEKTVYVIRTCSICLRKILATGTQTFTPSKEAHEMIVQVMLEFGYTNYSNQLNNGFGSMFYTDLPVHISRAIRDKGPEGALVQTRIIVADVKKTGQLKLFL